MKFGHRGTQTKQDYRCTCKLQEEIRGQRFIQSHSILSDHHGYCCHRLVLPYLRAGLDTVTCLPLHPALVRMSPNPRGGSVSTLNTPPFSLSAYAPTWPHRSGRPHTVIHKQIQRLWWCCPKAKQQQTSQTHPQCLPQRKRAGRRGLKMWECTFFTTCLSGQCKSSYIRVILNH